MTDLDDYDYDLPSALIAQEPAPHREESRALFMRRGVDGLEERRFADLPGQLTGDECLVVNDTRVIPARIRTRRASGARIEVFLLRPEGDASNADTVWQAWVAPAKKVRPPETLNLESDPSETIEVLQRCDSFFRVRAGSLDRLYGIGEVPLPPYIARSANDDRRTQDSERYQTMFASTPGAVAAPTAGLHFSPPLVTAVKSLGVPVIPITLHVGPGTFKPITTDRIEDHRVDPELFHVSEQSRGELAKAKADGRRIITVGTTSTRVIESIDHWDDGPAIQGDTSLTILPGYEFRHVEGLITNYHLPKSSLLVLVSAFHGRERTRQAYAQAIESGLRFYSYGDAMVILPRTR